MLSWQSFKTLGIDGLEKVELPKPIPGVGELLVKVEVAALNFSDILMISDNYQIKPTRPFIPGQEISGTVLEVNDRTSFEVGKRVASKVNWGGFVEYVVVRNDMAIVVPDSISLETAAALPISYTTSIVALTQTAHVQPGDFVLIHAAAGGVGLAAVQIACHLGAKVIATAGSDEKCQIATEQGAVQAINYREHEWRHAVLDATDGKGANVILDPVGGDVTLESLRCLAWQ
jgi:NADPH2:quinone reductase